MENVNLVSIVAAKKKLSSGVFESYLKSFGIKLDMDELDDLFVMIREMYEATSNIDVNLLGEFYIGYQIPQISKEFDLLRLGQDNIVNIELKREDTGEKIRTQLIQNQYYLNFLGKKVESFTYIASEKKLIRLQSDSTIKEVELNELITILQDQKLKDMTEITIDSLFKPSNYLVSPFNSTNAFMQGNYLLTGQQQEFKKKIMKEINTNATSFLSVSGAAGTGKTLLTYDIAKQNILEGKRVLVVHCGITNAGHEMLITDYNWSIYSIKNLSHFSKFDNYDLIIVDECQRIRIEQLDHIISMVNTAEVNCIFAYDGNQCLNTSEIRNKVPDRISEFVLQKNLLHLSEKIRSNKELANFTKKLFDLSSKIPPQVYKNINIKYFSGPNTASQYVVMLNEKGWKSIDYTPPVYADDPYAKYQSDDNENAHEVIGQEFDNVIIIIDKYFYYNEKILMSKHHSHLKAHYRADKMLFQMITRARNKLTVIIIDNENVLMECLRITQP